MSRYSYLLMLPLVAACAVTPPPGSDQDIPPTLPPQVASVLPPGTPVSSVFQNTDGCYLFSIERTDPLSGFQVRDADGNPICEGQQGL